jgi:uncharacterized membrane protein YhaH (DUF805 family)
MWFLHLHLHSGCSRTATTKEGSKVFHTALCCNGRQDSSSAITTKASFVWDSNNNHHRPHSTRFHSSRLHGIGLHFTFICFCRTAVGIYYLYRCIVNIITILILQGHLDESTKASLMVFRIDVWTLILLLNFITSLSVQRPLKDLSSMNMPAFLTVADFFNGQFIPTNIPIRAENVRSDQRFSTKVQSSKQLFFGSIMIHLIFSDSVGGPLWRLMQTNGRVVESPIFSLRNTVWLYKIKKIPRSIPISS